MLKLKFLKKLLKDFSVAIEKYKPNIISLKQKD
jgi:hypothetical protein